MNIRQFHIDFHLLRQQELGNDYTHLSDEKVDDYLNLSIEDFIRLKVNDKLVQEGNSNVITEQYYEGLQTLIRTTKLSMLTPYPYNDKGRSVDLSSIKSSSTSNKYAASGTLASGGEYRILSFSTGDDFTNVGAENATGNVFTASTATAKQPASRSGDMVLRGSNGDYITGTTPLKAGEPYVVLAGEVIFAAASLTGEGIIVDGKAIIDGANHIGDLTIIQGSTFVITDTLVPTTWSNCSVLERLDVGVDFYKFITSSCEISYSTGSAPATKIVKNRLVKARDVDTYLNHSRGTTISSPLSNMEGDTIVAYQNVDDVRVPTNERFTITSIIVKFYKKPNTVSITRNIDCDLETIDHPEILRKAVELASAATVANNYQTIAANNSINKTN